MPAEDHGAGFVYAERPGALRKAGGIQMVCRCGTVDDAPFRCSRYWKRKKTALKTTANPMLSITSANERYE